MAAGHREEQALAGLKPVLPGRKPVYYTKDRRIARLVQDHAKLALELKIARKVTDV